MKISFIGLGKLGLPLATCLAEVGNDIIAVDKNEYILDQLKNDKLPFYEPGLEELFTKVKYKFQKFTSSYETAIKETEASIILVNTQLGDDGYAADFVEAAILDIAVNLKKINKKYHNIILSSTVLPGTIKKLISTIEKISGKKFEQDFGFAYVPDFVKLGSVIHDFKNPDFFLVGCNNPIDMECVHKIWNGLHNNNCDYYSLTLEETEIAKVALNAYIVTKITFANFLGELCKDINNVNVHNITNVIGADQRIGRKFFSSGAPYGGTCFPRDATAFIKFAKNRNYIAKNLIFAQEVNEMILNSIFDQCNIYENIGVLGLSFKPNSPVVVGSPSISLIKKLNRPVNVFDYIKESYKGLDNIKICTTPQEVVDQSECVIIMHPDKRFSDLKLRDATKVIDLWKIIKS
jgi:UDPglucose 6-dehydrogenase